MSLEREKTGFLEGRDFFPNFVAAVENWTENRIEKKKKKNGRKKVWRKNRFVIRTWTADGPAGRILRRREVGGRKRINLIASLRIFSRIGYFRAKWNRIISRNPKNPRKLDELNK